ncbi:pyruvate, phosphate dikinase [Halorarum halophilum]|uniref:Probable phosphoenolpyruvate synthase n=1 Tax=Halorarum halophilum TaxID=2743090 RepID=A0A7D5KME2_9EURY|nr:PEP/pyruvate-binding domain-containing protein [Halobaculum halophilum]QLG27642.1 pyruvate, phosphate dikinase [Halobaculum halophilum]
MSDIGVPESLEADRPYVVSLDDPAATDLALVGGKGANLARLVEAGLPVPDGFCVTTVAYRELVSDESVDALFDRLSDLDPTNTESIADVGASLRTSIEALDLPPAVRDAIETALADRATEAGSETAYAVRSSATAEDLPDASFAGQQETFLNARGVEEIIDSVRACMASLFTDRAIAYRAKNGIPHEDVALSVVVQRMVTPEVSGIMFTADPTSGNRRITAIEAGLGLGEAFVSGEAAADSVLVDARTGEILDYEVGVQRTAIRPLPEGGVETVDLSADERSARALSDDQVRTLVKVGAEVEALFGHPQDVEWCLEDGSVRIVQSRPITTLFPVPTPEPSDDRLHVYYSLGHAQAFAEALPPLVRDIWMSYTETTFEEFGFDGRGPWAVEAGGRVYMDATNLLRVGILRGLVPTQLAATSEPMGAAMEAILEQRSEEFHTDRSVAETLAATPALARGMWRGLSTSRPLLSTMMDGFPGAFIGTPTPPECEEAKWTAWGRNIASQVRDAETPTERVRAVFDLLGDAIDFPPAGPLLAALAAGEVLERMFPDAPEDVNAVGRGFPEEVVTRINLGLGDLADIARDTSPVATALRQGAALDDIESLDGSEEFLTELDEFLDEFGHRATGEIDVSRPRWREDPSALLATIGANLEHGEAGEHRKHVRRMEREALAAAERLERRASHGPLGPLRRRVVRRLVRTYRGYIQTREYPKQGAAHMFTAWRDAFCDAGEVLVAEGHLSDPSDVWFLRVSELLAALDGESIDVDVAARRAEFERHKTMDAPPVLTSEGEAPAGRVNREDVPEGALVGTGVSGGVVEGVARVIRDPAKETIENGEILVAPSSDPGWTPLFLNAGGMVVEVGGRMSHGALVAREYGIPAVVSVPEATTVIETGQRIRIDGTRGIVEVLDS